MAVTGTILALLGFAAWRDLATRTIPDVISLGIIVLGVASRLCEGWQSLALSLFVAVAMFVALLPLHSRGLIGGADLKLLAALALGLSPLRTYHLLTMTALAGGALAGLYVSLRQILRPRLAAAAPFRRRRSVPSRIATVEAWRIRRRAPLPYGIAIALGAALVLNNPGV